MTFRGIKLMHFKIKPLRMHYYSSTPFIYHNRQYKSLYHGIYANIFPSRHDELASKSSQEIHDSELSLEKFEVTEEECARMLREMIMIKINSDVDFRNALLSTGSKDLFNNDIHDYYFGSRRNIYGKILMSCRDKLIDENE